MLKHVAAALVALSLVTTSAAMADSYRDHYSDRDSWNHHDERYDGDHDRDHLRASPYRESAGHYHYWRRDVRLPRAYYAPGYIVNDYHSYHLRRPPRGCHWVRVDRDAVLVAFATGVVVDAIYNRF